MQLLPTIVVFIIVALALVGVFSLISFIYFRMKRKRSYLNQEFSPNDNIDSPYLEMTPLNRSKIVDDFMVDIPTPKTTYKGNLNLSNMKKSRISSTSFSIPQINNSKTLQTTTADITEVEQKYSYISKLVNYTPNGLQLYTRQVVSVSNVKVFKNLKWENSFKTQPIVDRAVYTNESQNFLDLLDIFKLQPGEFKAVKFTIQVRIKNCLDEKTYYVEDLPKIERVETISQLEFNKLKLDFGNK